MPAEHRSAAKWYGGRLLGGNQRPDDCPQPLLTIGKDSTCGAEREPPGQPETPVTRVVATLDQP
jgi:hypothetical protein